MNFERSSCAKRRGGGAVIRCVVSGMLSSALVAALATPAWAISASYTVGDLNGQNGWDGGIVGGNPIPFTNNASNSNVVTTSDAFTGAQSWRYSGSYGSPGAGTPFSPDVQTVGAPNSATVFGPPLNSPITPVGDQSVVSFAFRAVTPGDGSRISIYEGSYTRDSRVGANLNMETIATGVHLYFFELSSSDLCSTQDFPQIDIGTVTAGVWHTVKMTTTYPDAVPGDIPTFGTTTYVVDEGSPGEIIASGDSPWVHGFNFCNGTAYTPGGSLKFSNSFNDYPVHSGFYIDDVSMVITSSASPELEHVFTTSFELCNGNSDCNDANDCTDDVCDSGLGCQNTNNAAACTDGDACTTEVCSGGACVGGGATDCDDLNICTDDSCDVGLGCQNANNTGPCTDGNACTTESCSGGTCASGPATDCGDANVCTDDTCDTVLGCQNPNNTGPCTDGNACTTESCSGGTCVGGAATNCDDLNVCTDDSCDISLGCQHPGNTGPCSDGNACTTESCSGGTCAGGPPTNCGDANVCTDDTCDTVLGCQHPNNTGPCTDGNICTTESCVGGTCAATPTTCDDANVCTSDSCDLSLGCQHANVAGACSDGNACTLSDTCSVGVCTPGGAVSCEDGDPCSNGTCDPETGECTDGVVPATGCLEAGNSALRFNLAGDRTAGWNWMRGELADCADFGNPTVDTDYDVCVYDQTGVGEYELATSFHLPANSTWEMIDQCTWAYRDLSHSVDGITKLILKPGARGKLRLRAKGANTPMPTPVSSSRFFAMNPTVTVQMHSGTGTCWQSETTQSFRNTGTKFKSRRRPL